MKRMLALVAILLSVTGTASASLVCSNPATTSLTVTTDEGVTGEIVSITAWYGAVGTTFGREANTTIQRDSFGKGGTGTVYMASKGNSILTLSMPQRIPEGKKAAATVYFAVYGKIVKEVLHCSDESYEGN